jgi:hypothetical protein
VDDLNDEFNTKPCLEALDEKAAATCAGTFIDATSLENQLWPITRKRTASRVDTDISKMSKRVKPPCKDRGGSASTSGSNIHGGPRVGCPFYKKAPKAHGHVSSCRGKGFVEVAKIV